MRYISLFLFISVLLSCRSTPVQPEFTSDKVLLEVAGKKVTIDEFIYSFHKSHQNEDSISQADIDDYLELFINYKLKVEEARRAGYDTVAAYKEELSMYQEQLKSSYRTSEHIVDSLKKEAYQRLSEELNVSHILIMLPENPTPEDTIKAYQRIQELKNRASTEDFGKLASQHSEDPSARSNSGNLGYFTAFQMIYPFESAAYNTPVGEISAPVRTRYGYHILKVHDKRKATGSYKMDQLQIQAKDKKDSVEAANLIFDLHEMLKNGLSMEQVVESVNKERFFVRFGPLPALSLNQMPTDVQEAVVHFSEQGELSDPVASEEGWHIFIFKEKEAFPAYTAMEPRLDRMVRRTDRLEIYQKQVMEQLYEKHQLDLRVGKEQIFEILKTSDEKQVLFTLGGSAFMIGHFEEYLTEENIDKSDKGSVVKAYGRYIEENVSNLEDKELIEENAELKWLLKEYEEGMLLFNIMEDSVWNKGAADSIGFREFQKGMEASDKEGTANLKPTSRAITDYQDYLEKIWVARLRERYNVVINQQMLDELYAYILKNEKLHH